MSHGQPAVTYGSVNSPKIWFNYKYTRFLTGKNDSSPITIAQNLRTKQNFPKSKLIWKIKIYIWECNKLKLKSSGSSVLWPSDRTILKWEFELIWRHAPLDFNFEVTYTCECLVAIYCAEGKHRDETLYTKRVYLAFYRFVSQESWPFILE